MRSARGAVEKWRVKQRGIRRCHNVFPTGQEFAKLAPDLIAAATGYRREVSHAVRIQGENSAMLLVAVTPTADSPMRFTAIPTRLVRGMNQLADQLEPLRPEDLPKGDRAGVTGPDVRHPSLSPCRLPFAAAVRPNTTRIGDR